MVCPRASLMLDLSLLEFLTIVIAPKLEMISMSDTDRFRLVLSILLDISDYELHRMCALALQRLFRSLWSSTTKCSPDECIPER